MKLNAFHAVILYFIVHVNGSVTEVKEPKSRKIFTFPKGCKQDIGLMVLANKAGNRAHMVVIKNNSKCKLVLMDAVQFSGRWIDRNKKEEKDVYNTFRNAQTPYKSVYNPPTSIEAGKCDYFAILSTEAYTNAEGWARYRCAEDNTAIHIHFINPIIMLGYCKVKSLAFQIKKTFYQSDSYVTNHICVLEIEDIKKSYQYADDELDYNCRCPSPNKFYYRDRHYEKKYNESFCYSVASHYRIV